MSSERHPQLVEVSFRVFRVFRGASLPFRLFCG